MAFAVANFVTLSDYETASVSASREVAPRLKQQTGVLNAIWLADREHGEGMSVIVFESREMAEAMAERLRSGDLPTPPGVKFDRHEVYEVITQF